MTDFYSLLSVSIVIGTAISSGLFAVAFTLKYVMNQQMIKFDELNYTLKHFKNFKKSKENEPVNSLEEV